ncbi:ABC transporter membrane protein [Salmonella enterica subsp. enterica serovar Pullorum]|nr:ABC transporter membrane protein [Salmonella enterica subsp. enterica serovar Pullorum]
MHTLTLKTCTWVHYRHFAVTGAVYLGNRSGDAESASGRSAVSRATAFDAGLYVHVFCFTGRYPERILLSRPAAKGFAEYVMQIFNVGNTLPPLAVLALAMVIIGIGDTPAIVALFLASLPCLSSAQYLMRASVPFPPH